jgi:hypothetical protein
MYDAKRPHPKSQEGGVAQYIYNKNLQGRKGFTALALKANPKKDGRSITECIM